MTDPVSHRKVLVVEDQGDFAEGVAEVLETNGYEVEIAFDRKVALGKVEKELCRVALIDLWDASGVQQRRSAMVMASRLS